jgi:hypothetical protein
MDRENIYRQNLHEQDLAALAELCGNVANSRSADHTQSETAHALRMEWFRLRLDGSLNGGKTEAEVSLRKRMAEFLAGVPAWMLSGIS